MDDYKYFEDFEVGQTAETGEIEMTEAEIIKFAKEFDPQPMHVDPEAAKHITGGLIASGWHTASTTMKLMVTRGDYRAAPGTVGMGFESLKWTQPVRPGDRLRLRLQVLAVRASQSKPGWGIVTNKFTTVNQRGETVQEMQSSAIFPMRNK
jgi:acyl dehydratase